MEYKEISSYRSIVANTTAILNSPHSRNAPASIEDLVDGQYKGKAWKLIQQIIYINVKINQPSESTF